MNKNHLSILTAIFLALPFESVMHAAIIRNVTITNVYSEFVSGTDLRTATNLLNGSGLFGDHHTVSPQGCMWLTSTPTPPAGDFTNAFVTFDLGSLHTLDRMKVWNYNEAGNLTRRGIQRADILTAGEDFVFTTAFSNVFFERAPGVFTNFGQTISLGGLQARYVRFNVITNQDSTA